MSKVEKETRPEARQFSDVGETETDLFCEDFPSRFSNLSMKDVPFNPNEARSVAPRYPRDSDLSMCDAGRRSGAIAASFFNRLSDLSMDSVSYGGNGTGFNNGGFNTNSGFSTGRAPADFSTGTQKDPALSIKQFDLGNGTSFSTGPNQEAGKPGVQFSRDLSGLAYGNQTAKGDCSHLQDGRNYSDLSVDSVEAMRCSNLSQGNFFRSRDDVLHESPNDAQEPPDNVEEPPNDFKYGGGGNMKHEGMMFAHPGQYSPARNPVFFQTRNAEVQGGNGMFAIPQSIGRQEQKVEAQRSGIQAHPGEFAVPQPVQPRGPKPDMFQSQETTGNNDTEEEYLEFAIPEFIDAELEKMNGSGEFKITELMIMLFYVHYFFDHTDVYSKASDYMKKKRSRASIRHKIIKIVHKNSGHKGSILQNKKLTSGFKNILCKEFWEMIENAGNMANPSENYLLVV
eukprot:CAMPEP_0204862374 /NCGR_PEP_ID=MMETSP1348-20121228/2437_1 /ASSEMBLY_ACC=CAM_ASM_000700 /TAXON_ID=215587 /ORGANISM="Aplanochytrium stocchinoi, Strain GSBS06" /LENGTH=453 /DNA_ID=CAMNT_0052012255 /DNA_START=226 /DNA_END=1588 /DNA_ORIENTATION=+